MRVPTKAFWNLFFVAIFVVAVGLVQPAKAADWSNTIAAAGR